MKQGLRSILVSRPTPIDPSVRLTGLRAENEACAESVALSSGLSTYRGDLVLCFLQMY